MGAVIEGAPYPAHGSSKAHPGYTTFLTAVGVIMLNGQSDDHEAAVETALARLATTREGAVMTHADRVAYAAAVRLAFPNSAHTFIDRGDHLRVVHPRIAARDF